MQYQRISDVQDMPESGSNSGFNRLPLNLRLTDGVRDFRRVRLVAKSPSRPNRLMGDVWTCCQCGSANLSANCAERCPICAHYTDDLCDQLIL